MSEPPATLHPEVVVDLRGQENAPVACVAVVRRALQKAGYPDDASRFTDLAFLAPAEQIFATARRFVTVRL